MGSAHLTPLSAAARTLQQLHGTCISQLTSSVSLLPHVNEVKRGKMTPEILQQDAQSIFERSRPIRTIADECRLQLQECIRTQDVGSRYWAENRLSDYNLWDAGVGASAGTSSSLDTRLANDISARDVVIGSIDTLAAWARKWKALSDAYQSVPKSVEESLDFQEPSAQTRTGTDNVDSRGAEDLGVLMQGTERFLPENEEVSQRDDADITLQEAKNSVEQMLRVLIDLATSIRKAGTTSRLKIADHTFDASQKDTLEVVENFTRYLQLLNYISVVATREERIGDNDATAQKQIHVPIAREGDMRLSDPLRPEQRVIVTSMAKRAHRFYYYQDRKRHLSRAVDQHQPEPEADSSSNHNRTLNSSSVVMDRPATHTLRKMPATSDVDVSEPTRSERSNATSGLLSEFPKGQPLDAAIDPTVEGPPPTAIASRVDYPKPPEIIPGAAGLECPYCFVPLRADFAKMSKWR